MYICMCVREPLLTHFGCTLYILTGNNLRLRFCKRFRLLYAIYLFCAYMYVLEIYILEEAPVGFLKFLTKIE